MPDDEPFDPVDPPGEAVDAAEDEPTKTRTERRVSTNRSPSTRGRLTVWAAIVVLVCALVTAAVQGWQYNDQRRLDAARQQALAAARQTTVNFVTISAATVDRDLQRVADGATGDFKDEFTQSEPQVKAAVVENKVDSRGTVLRAAIVSADRTSAVVLVAVDATVRNVNAPTGRLAHYRIRVNLALVNGVWLVSTLEFVG
jgi:Mce-associated membrane protein